MSETMKRYLVSSATTFVTTFAGSISLQLSVGTPTELNQAFVLSILAVAGRAAVKAVLESLFRSSGDK